jgi:auxin efflux carrier family protein
MGGHKLIAKDFDGPGVEDDEVREAMRKKRKAMVMGLVKFFRVFRVLTPHRIDDESLEVPSLASYDVGKNEEDNTSKLKTSSQSAPLRLRPAILHRSSSNTAGRHVSFHHDDGIASVDSPEMLDTRACSPATMLEIPISQVTSPALTTTQVESLLHTESHTEPKVVVQPDSSPPGQTPSQPATRLHRIWRSSVPIIRALFTPASMSIIISFPIAMIKPLKGLFVPVANSGIPNAPDGLPPLSFILDTTTFLGGASVPLGLICLGSALARLKVPLGQLTSLPLGAISGMAVGRLIVFPILGVGICQALTRAGVIDANDKVLRLVCM